MDAETLIAAIAICLGVYASVLATLEMIERRRGFGRPHLFRVSLGAKAKPTVSSSYATMQAIHNRSRTSGATAKAISEAIKESQS